MKIVYENEILRDPNWIYEHDARFLLNDYDRDVVVLFEHYSLKVKFAQQGLPIILFRLDEVLALANQF